MATLSSSDSLLNPFVNSEYRSAVEREVKSLTGYIWEDSLGSDRSRICVVVPNPEHIIWRSWLERTDARLRRFHDDGYWVFDYRLKRDVESCFLRAGWSYLKTRPGIGVFDQLRAGLKNGCGLSHYSVLYVVEGAPRCVVDAAYKALMLMVHPDRGGDEDAAKRLNDAREGIYSERGW